ncbi:death-on-curing family protein [Pleurocapsa sp. PCC 7327]|uniref:type II toxin-antitoxin system death-on-curing family toxin n=1 Tax=Pleurocapsa sp. PCC 7327 TaxID=118163 RepID=UPI00029FB74D|nr:type II toxin-antitoxin system death-on-curing family toxin [Pleurocapsa sp. PCC 7327]AFY78591.1 death-on-curing family protein [Pleurocapsa sp. PCC 7327]
MTGRESVWLSEKAIKAIYEILIARTGGTFGVLDPGMLESTLAKPKNLYYYSDRASIFRLAATYGYGFIKNHCFVDGNKRVALAAVAVFLIRNGYRLNASEVEAATFFLNLASRIESQDEGIDRLTEWIEKNSNPIEKSDPNTF